MSAIPATTTPTPPMPVPSASPTAQEPASGAHDDFFHGLLEIVNPLQHFPIVSTVYRAITRHQITPVERIAGDPLYGGLIGFASSVANVTFQEITGKDFG